MRWIEISARAVNANSYPGDEELTFVGLSSWVLNSLRWSDCNYWAEGERWTLEGEPLMKAMVVRRRGDQGSPLEVLILFQLPALVFIFPARRKALQDDSLLGPQCPAQGRDRGGAYKHLLTEWLMHDSWDSHNKSRKGEHMSCTDCLFADDGLCTKCFDFLVCILDI